MPERRLLRRTAYLSALFMSVGAFAFSAMTIAGTQGHVRSGTDASVAAMHLERVSLHRCHHGRPVTAAAPKV
jgi:hypothetical protein